MRKLLLLFGLLVFCAIPSHATTRTAATCAQADVQAQINLSANGDTVNIPNGNCDWSGTINLTVGITLQGLSSGCGTVSNQGTATATPNCGLIINDKNLTSCSPNFGAPCPTNSNLIVIHEVVGFHTIIGNMAFLPGTCTNTGGHATCGAYIQIIGSDAGSVPLMHDMAFNIPNFFVTDAVQWLVSGGVIWNTIMYSTNNINGACAAGTIGSQSGSLVIKSNKNWDDPDTFGTADTTGTNNTYIEDSIFSYVGQIPDIDDNGRVVARYSTFENIAGGLTHGTSSPYGGRQFEYYQDTFLYTNNKQDTSRYFWGRAGTGLFTQNHFDLNTGSCHGTRDSLQYIVENAATNTGHGCSIGYQSFHQVGSGIGSTAIVHTPSNVGPINGTPVYSNNDDVYQISVPIYMWNNSGAGAKASLYGTNDDANTCGNINPATGNLFVTTDFYKQGAPGVGRDGIVCEAADGCNVNGAGAAKPGWAPYTYPHPLRALVTGTVSISPLAVLYGSVNVGATSPPQTLTVSNTSGSTITFTSVPTYSGTNAADFATASNLCGGTLTNGNSCTFTVTFKPSIPSTESATVSIAFTGFGGSPLSASLSGTGVSVPGATPAPAQTMMSGYQIRRGEAF